MSYQQLVATESTALVESNIFTPVEVAQAEILEQLTHDEECDRRRLELVAEQAFYQAGKALAQLRERRLYRSTHKTFAAYCKARFGYTRRKADYLINGAEVVENLRQMRTIHAQNWLNEPTRLNEKLRTIHAHILPTNLEQVRHLTSLKTPEEQQQAWAASIEKADGKVPSGRIVKGIVEQLKEKPQVLAQDYCQAGDVFTLVKLKGKEQKYNGCWAIAVELTDSAVIVDVHDATLTVKLNNLDKLNSPLDVKQQLHQTLRRIRQLRGIGLLDRGAENILENLGKHTELTSMEADLLSWLEKQYKVDEQVSINKLFDTLTD